MRILTRHAAAARRLSARAGALIILSMSAAILAGAAPATAADRYIQISKPDGKTPLGRFWFWDAEDKVQLVNYSQGRATSASLFALNATGKVIRTRKCTTPLGFRSRKVCDYDFQGAVKVGYVLMQVTTTHAVVRQQGGFLENR